MVDAQCRSSAVALLLFVIEEYRRVPRQAGSIELGGSCGVHDKQAQHITLELQPPRQVAIPRYFDFAAKIAAIYLLISILWIIGSDRLVDWTLPQSEFASWVQSAKGLVFVSISAAVLYLAVHLYIKRLASSAEELQDAWDESLLGWAMAMDAREPNTAQHSQRVASLTVMLARAMHVDPRDLPAIYRGALLHDIGKIGVPDSVLQYPGPLDEQQWMVMRQHPDIARQILSPITFLKSAMDIPYCHHEKWDGSGYPRGLRGAEIPLWARMFAVIDVFDALTSTRVYRQALPTNLALDEIRAGSGAHFDPEVVDAFDRLMRDQNLKISSA